MRERLAAAAVAVTLVLAGFAAGVANAYVPGRPSPCPSTGCATPNPSATPRPTPKVIGIPPLPSVSLIPIPELLPDTSTH